MYLLKKYVKNKQNLKRPNFSPPVGSSIMLELVLAVHNYHKITYSANGSKLIFHMRMYLYDTSRNIQEP